MDVLERLRAVLAHRTAAAMPERGAVACAVLVPVMLDDDDFELVYTVRSHDLPIHAGQVAFPGGKFATGIDADLADTALRESHEEIGIQRQDVSIIGTLDPVHTLSGDFVITPYVGVVQPPQLLRPNFAEVSEVFTVKRIELDDPGRHDTEVREWRGQRFEVPLIRVGRHVIWGATHRITMDLLERLALPR